MREATSCFNFNRLALCLSHSLSLSLKLIIMKFGVKVVFPVLPRYSVIPSISTPQNNDDLVCNINFNNQEIDLVKLLSFLGVLLDVNLLWFQIGQIEKLSTRLNSACYQIRVLQDIVDFNTMKTVYYAVFFLLPSQHKIWVSSLMQLLFSNLSKLNFSKKVFEKKCKAIAKK